MKKLIVLFLLISTVSLSQNAVTEYYEYNITDGLVDNWVNDFEKDANGFVWIATNDGISRFDGYNFINFSDESHSNIAINTSFHEIFLHGDLLYALSKDKGVYTINTKTLQLNQIDKNGVFSFDILGKESLIYYSNGLLILKENEKIVAQRKFAKPVYDGKGILTKNKIVFNNSFSSILLLDRKLQVLDHPKLNKNANGISLARHPKLGVYYASSKGAFSLREKSFEAFGKRYENNELSFFQLTREGLPFYILNHKQPYVPINDSSYCFTFDKTLNIEIRTIYHLGGAYWLIGTNQGFVKLNLSSRFNKQIKDDLFRENQIRVRRKIISSDNKIYFFGFPGVLSYDLKSKIQEKISEDVKDLSQYDAVKIGQYIFATSEGFGLWKISVLSNQISKISTNLIGPFAYFHCLHKVNNRQLLLGGNGEIILFDVISGESERYRLNIELEVLDIATKTNGHEFLIASNNGLFEFSINGQLKNNKTTTITLKRKAGVNNRVKDIHFHSKQNKFWLATDKGVIVLDGSATKVDRTYEGNNVITNPKVTGLLEDENGNIWASTYSGITCFNVNNGKNYFVTTKHGLANSEFNYKSFEKLSDGRLIFGGLYGYDVIDPKLFNYTSSNTKILFSGYRTEKPGENKTFDINQSNIIQFDTGQEDLLLYFSTTDFNNAEMYTMEYKINEGEWQKLTNKNVLRISNLKEGANILTIRLRDSFSNICDEKSFEILAEIPFYQEIWFYVLVFSLLLLLSFLVLYYLYRMRRVEVDTKKRISMDLHDETGTILTRVLLMSKSEAMVVKNLGVFQSNLKEALFSLRTFMDSLSGKKGYLSDLLIELKEFISESFRGTPIRAKLTHEKIDTTWLSAELYRDIKLCIYESIQNTLKHSNASEFELKIYQENSRLFLVIADNGETHLSLEKLEENGNGFSNFHKRTKRHNGVVKIELKGEKKSVLLSFEFSLK